MKRRIILVVGLIIAIILFVLSIIINNSNVDVYDSGNLIMGDNSGGSKYEKNVLDRLEFSSLEEAIPVVTKRDSSYEDGEIIYQTTVEDYAVVFFKQETKLAEYKLATVIGYEFVVNENGTFSYMGRRVCNNTSSMRTSSYGWKQTVLADLGYSTNSLYKEQLNIKETYGVLPAWGISDNELVKDMKVDGQCVDEVIEFSVEGKIYYFWFIADLQTNQEAMNIEIKTGS